MESVHKNFKYAWIDEDIINVREFIEGYIDFMLDGIPMYSNQFEDSYSEEEVKETEEACGLESMKCTYQDRMEMSTTIQLPEGADLDTLTLQAKDIRKRKIKKHYNAHMKALKYKDYPPNKIFNHDFTKLEHSPVKTPEVVLYVQIFVPIRKHNKHVGKSGKPPLFQANQEFLVLGCNRLTQLRDAIECISDKAIPGDLSECPDDMPSETAKDMYKSGFFYINGVFYNDMRDKNCRDYSEPIIKWSKNRGIGPFKKASMEETVFRNLTVQLGSPYVYVHQGDCEHIITFSDLRIFHDHEYINNENAYPLLTQISSSRRVMCMVCRLFGAQWLVDENKRLPENPYFFCKKCYTLFNYDKDGEKIGDFKAYYYPEQSSRF